jgi:hypothetical protein
LIFGAFGPGDIRFAVDGGGVETAVVVVVAKNNF